MGDRTLLHRDRVEAYYHYTISVFLKIIASEAIKIIKTSASNTLALSSHNSANLCHLGFELSANNIGAETL